MDPLVIILGIGLALFIAYIFLSELGSEKKRTPFDDREYTINKVFKSTMQPDGEFRSVDESLYEFPAIAAGMLKYKKHEWIIVAFEKDKRVHKIWINKGIDDTTVSLRLPFSTLVDIAVKEGCSAVLVFHNHPNANPSYYKMNDPSDQDIKFANSLAALLQPKGISLIEFICERGRHYKFFSTIDDLSTYVRNPIAQ